MSATVLGKCPGCKKTLRLPAQAAGKTVRCVHCGMVCEVKSTTGLVPARGGVSDTIPVAGRAVPPPSQPVPVVFPASSAQTSTPPGGAPVHHVPGESRNAWAGIVEDGSGQADVVTISPRYRKKRYGWIFAIVSLLILGVGLVGTAVVILKFVQVYKERESKQAEAPDDAPDKESDKTNGTIATPSTSSKQHDVERPTKATPVANSFPRRLLGISINNYIYANPTSYGRDSRGFIKRDFGQTLEKLASKFRIPANQVYELSDAAAEKTRKPPLKLIVEQAITRYLQSCRAQDRIVLLLCAHTIEIEGKPYVVPLEGDLDEAKTLIPLEWIMEQLDKCPAQQKVFVADFNRFDRARGKERPTGGRLSASAEAMLKNPPEGVQVWSACSAGQYSFEFDDYYSFEPSGSKDGQGIKGGAFLSLFSVAFLQGIGGIQKPDDPLPIERLAQSVNANTMALSKELDDPDADAAEEPTKIEKKDDKKPDKKDDKKDAKAEMKPSATKRKALQTPFLVGAMKGQPIGFNADEPAAKVVVIPTPEEVFEKGVMKQDEVKKIIDLLTLPPIKQARSTESLVRVEQVLPFMVSAMQDYRNDVPIDRIKKDPSKYPVRFAAIDALEKLRSLTAGGLALPTELRESDRTDAAKAGLGKLQRGPARVMETLEALVASLQKAVEER